VQKRAAGEMCTLLGLQANGSSAWNVARGCVK